MSTYIKAEQGVNHTVIYHDESGKLYIFSGGTWTWRNHNPGNIVPGRVSDRHCQIGKAGGFAVIPDYNSGFEALIDCLKTTFWNTSIDQMIEKYAPSKENNTERYRQFLIKKTGVSDGRKIKDFSPDEFKKLWEAIIQYEGYKEGNISEIHRVTLVKRNRKGICELLVETIGWLTKKECISLAKNGLVNLVVCISASGNEYLRARPNDPFQQDLHQIVLRGLQ